MTILAHIWMFVCLWFWIGWACWFSNIAGTPGSWGKPAGRDAWRTLVPSMLCGMFTLVWFFKGIWRTILEHNPHLRRR